MSDTNEKTGERIEAAKILLKRGWGKAPISIETDSPAKFVLVSAFAVTPQKKGVYGIDDSVHFHLQRSRPA